MSYKAMFFFFSCILTRRISNSLLPLPYFVGNLGCTQEYVRSKFKVKQILKKFTTFADSFILKFNAFDNTRSATQQPPQHGGAVPDPIWVESKWLLAFPRVPVTSGTPLTQTIFLPYCPWTTTEEHHAASLKSVTCLFSSPTVLLPVFVCSPIRSSPTDGRTDSFSPSILSSSRNLFILGDFNCHHPLWDSRGTSDPRREKVFDWVISLDLHTLNDPGIPTLLHRSSPDISFAPSTIASGRCFNTWVLITHQLYQPSLLLWSFASTNVSLLLTFRELAGMALLFTLILTVFLQRNTRFFLLPLLLLSLLLWH